MTRSCTAFVAALLASATAHCAETDQYLVWDVELSDSALVVNSWLNREFDEFLTRINSDPERQEDSADQIAIAFMRHVFRVRPLAHINELYDSGQLDEYPPREEVNFFEYQRMSIYRGPAFPFLLFMARTIRIGDVYLGIDKLSHLFGFGRRYFVDYIDLEREGLDNEIIVERLIEQGMGRELWFTGRAINGVISPSDLEANYQGLLFAMSLCRGETAVLVKRDEQWRQSRPIDIRPFITPHLDESYYPNRYWAARKRQVTPLVQAEYHAQRMSPLVQARFATYETCTPSVNVRYVERLLRDGETPAVRQR